MSESNTASKEAEVAVLTAPQTTTTDAHPGANDRNLQQPTNEEDQESGPSDFLRFITQELSNGVTRGWHRLVEVFGYVKQKVWNGLLLLKHRLVLSRKSITSTTYTLIDGTSRHTVLVVLLAFAMAMMCAGLVWRWNILTQEWHHGIQTIEVPVSKTCPVHVLGPGDPIRNGLVPDRLQDDFAKAAWNIPTNYAQWVQFGERPIAMAFDTEPEIEQEVSLVINGISDLLKSSTSTGLEDAIRHLHHETQPLVRCLRFLEIWDEGIITNPTMSLSCKWRIFFHWHGLKNVALVLGNVDNIVQISTKALVMSTMLQSNLKLIRDFLQSRRDLLANRFEDIVKEMSNVTNADLSSFTTFEDWAWEPTSRQYDFQLSINATESEYLHVQWLDLNMAAFEGFINAKIPQLESIIREVQELAQSETLKSIIHIVTNNAFYSAKGGVLDMLPLRALNRLDSLLLNSTYADDSGFHLGAFNWAEEHMPDPGEKCTCIETVRKARWTTYIYSKEKQAVSRRIVLQGQLWDDMAKGMMTWHHKTLEGHKLEGPDIRTFISGGEYEKLRKQKNA